MTRRILAITAGETPQIITETLYSLLSQPDAWAPDELHLATTATGKALFEQGGGRLGLPPLLGKEGKLTELYRSMDLVDQMPRIDWILPLCPDGSPFADIRAHDEVEAFAEALFLRMQELTADAQSEIHLSIAGGRKTMSFIAGQVMSLCARHQDRMSHWRVHFSPEEITMILPGGMDFSFVREFFED